MNCTVLLDYYYNHYYLIDSKMRLTLDVLMLDIIFLMNKTKMHNLS